MKKCPHCGEVIQDNSIFCRYCGKKLSSMTVTAVKKQPSRAKINKNFEDQINKGAEEAKMLAAAEAERAVAEHRERYDSQPVWQKFLRYIYGYNTGCGRFIIAVLAIFFVLLKSTSIITWSWWWVLSPLWLPLLLSLLFYFFGFTYFLILEATKRK